MRSFRVSCLMLAMACTSTQQADSSRPTTLVAAEHEAATETLEPATIQIRGEHDRGKALAVAEATVDTLVIGQVARTRLTMVFENPHDRVLEGELVFPLPADATVSGYALDIDGQLVNAVVVEKEKARVVFEKEVRKGVDPGIVEWVGGNSFRTRVYPIPAKGKRTIRVEFVRHLHATARGPVLHVPLSFATGIKTLNIRLDTAGGGRAPETSWQGMAPIALTQEHGRFKGSESYQGNPIQGRLTVTLGGDVGTVATELSPTGETHFLVGDVLGDLPAGERQDIRHAVIYWDASLSRRSADHQRVLAGLESLFAAIGTKIEIEFVPFSNAKRDAVRLSVDGADIRALRKAAASVVYDGGTQLGIIESEPQSVASDLTLLITDGVSNFGRSRPSAFKTPVYTISTASVANRPFLRWLSESTGGLYFDLATQEPDAVAAAASADPIRVTAVEVLTGRVEQVLPPVGSPVADQLWLAGKLKSSQATIRVSVGRGDEVLLQRTYELSDANAPKATLLSRVWAQKQAAQLAAFPKANAQALVDLGKRYDLVTPGTSMIVLERLEQYVEHAIRPPSSLNAMRAAYDKHDGQRLTREHNERKQKLERIVTLWNSRLEWWTKQYPKHAPTAKKEMKKSMRRNGHAGAGASRSRPASMAAESQEMDARADREDSAPSAKRAKSDQQSQGGPTIEIKAWVADMPYLKTLGEASKDQAYAVYLRERESYYGSPAFFLDCADFFFRHEMPFLGLRVLSNVAELGLEDAPLMRVLAHRLAQLNLLELAMVQFEQVKRWRPEEPQSYRDLALVLARLGQYTRAMELLAHVVMNTWDRFAEIELIALMELNEIVPKARAAGIDSIPLDSRLIRLLDVDIRISLSWDADLTDIDMWVMEPSGEKAYYAHNRSYIGGLVSRDFTQGYGPEEYMIREAMPGKYTVQANFYGSRAQKLTGAVTVQLELFTNYGRPNQKRVATTLRLTEKAETVTVGTMTFGGSPKPRE